MNKRKKILTDRKLPGSDEIAKFDDFEKVLNNYTLARKTLLNTILKWTIGGITTASIIVAGVMYFNSQNKIQPVGDNKAPVINNAYVQPPLNDKGIPFIENSIDALKGGEIKYPSGTALQIPNDAFVFEDGSPVLGEVKMKFREFKELKDVFLSDIPMQYDSAGKVYALGLTGMVQIVGTLNNKSVKLKPGKTVKFITLSAYTDDNYNIYQLDTVTKSWKYAGKNFIIDAAAISQKNISQKRRASTIIKPKRADDSKIAFAVKLEKKKDPEFAPFENVKFQVIDNNFDDNYLNEKWRKISIMESSIKGVYVASFMKADTTISAKVVPVFIGEDYDEALKKYNEEINKAQNISEQTGVETNKNTLKTPGRILVLNQLGICTSGKID